MEETVETPVVKSFKEKFMEVINAPDTKPWLFEVGQKVRIKKSVLEDGQTPKYWAGAVGVIVRRHNTMIHKDHWYFVRHDNGREDEFREYELDLRYSKHI